MCKTWMDMGTHRTCIFRFKRFFNNSNKPLVRHWTVISSINDTTLSLYDSSHDAESIQHLHPESFVTDIKKIDKKSLVRGCLLHDFFRKEGILLPRILHR